tara:strand:+ start:324 stop:488 length:165 start_codon:yes stop_codon:yes gene_type:complete
MKNIFLRIKSLSIKRTNKNKTMNVLIKLDLSPIKNEIVKKIEIKRYDKKIFLYS